MRTRRRSQLDREVFALALPAFATLVAEPLLVMVDSAIVGHLSTDALAGLGIAASVVSLTLGLCIFLAYATTAMVARRLGAGDLRGALAGGLDGMTLALILGSLLAVTLGFLATPIVGLYSVTTTVAALASTYLSVVATGFPAALTMLAATGVLRGLQDTRTPLIVALAMNMANVIVTLGCVHGLGMGIRGAALGTLIAQWAAAGALTTVVLIRGKSHGVRWSWHPAGVLHAARAGGWLVVRTAGLLAALLVATAAAAAMGTVALAAHQILNGLWMLLVMAMDAVAIAAQAIVGRYLGAGDAQTVRVLLARLLGWATAVGSALGLALWLLHPLYLWLFTPDAQVQGMVAAVLPIMAAITLIAATVFVLDGVLIGAGDMRYLAVASVINLTAYLPLVGLVVVTDAGLVWLWVAYAGLTVCRLATLGLRARGDTWLRLGSDIDGVAPV